MTASPSEDLGTALPPIGVVSAQNRCAPVGYPPCIPAEPARAGRQLVSFLPPWSSGDVRPLCEASRPMESSERGWVYCLHLGPTQAANVSCLSLVL